MELKTVYYSCLRKGNFKSSFIAQNLAVVYTQNLLQVAAPYEIIWGADGICRTSVEGSI